MKYEIGDEILVLATNEEGRIKEFINESMVIVEVRGVKFPIHTDQIDFPYFKRFSEKKIVQTPSAEKNYIDQIPLENKKQTNDTAIKENNGVWLGLIPKFYFDEFGDDIVECFKVYLINKTNDKLQFFYSQETNKYVDFELKSTIFPQKDIYLHDIELSKFSDNPVFAFEFSLDKEDKKRAPYFEKELKLRAKQTFQQIEKLKENNEAIIYHLLFKTYPLAEKEQVKNTTMNLDPLKKAGFKIYSTHGHNKKLPQARSVVDLHIEKIKDNWQGLSNFEILSIQLREFEKWYELAVVNQLPSFIVIHGSGSGKLKDSIHDLLKAKKEVKSFVNQYDSRFGYGATEIFFY